MNYKEKYEKAVQAAMLAKQDTESAVTIRILEEIFPELRESEDERIRESLLKYLHTLPNHYTHSGVCALEWIAWIEKQGKCETDCHRNHQDANYPNGGIVLEDFNGGEGFYKLNLDYLNKKQVEEVEEMVKTWNKESKTSNENIKNCIGMCLTDANEQRFKDYNTTLKDCLDWLEKQGKQKPTEEYNITSIKSKHAQGKLGEMIKKLKPISKVLEQKPAEWSEEDENKFKIVINALVEDYEAVPELINWFKSLKYRVQPKQEWSEDDEKITKWVIDYISNCPNESFDFYGGVGKEAVLSWLNKLKNILQLQPKKEWSEEDERIRIETIELLETANHPNVLHRNGKPLDFTENINWLKSLRPQFHWKPSEGQMNALDDVISSRDIKYDVLSELWKGLKKLREG